MEEGQLKKRIRNKMTAMGNYEGTDAMPYDIFKILDEAKKEFPLKEEQYKANWNPTETAIQDIWTLDPDKIMAWFKKWFGR